ncbi:hypothetical protein [Burkholderia ubonensis]|uniref:hypothetical protein n=1 Tax=Burkholderia ubonensis TaxID=101571 RepID=UPI001E4E0B37|nr:hypothetical protein [Burkholderia ubonensis]
MDIDYPLVNMNPLIAGACHARRVLIGASAPLSPTSPARGPGLRAMLRRTTSHDGKRVARRFQDKRVNLPVTYGQKRTNSATPSAARHAARFALLRPRPYNPN